MEGKCMPAAISGSVNSGIKPNVEEVAKAAKKPLKLMYILYKFPDGAGNMPAAKYWISA